MKSKLLLRYGGVHIVKKMPSMMKITYLLMVTGLLCFSSNAFTQNKESVSGYVYDQNGESLIGVSVSVKGTTNGTITDIDGKWNFAVKVGDIIQFNYLGFEKQELTYNIGVNTKIILKEAVTGLDEIVVTAMGIERQAKTLTYATQKVNSEELTRAKDVNFINALQGKSAGLTITPNSSGAGGGSSKILLRGSSSISGGNQPLIVLDGIPQYNGSGGGSTSLQFSMNQDHGDMLSTINPDDIENMTILKGANAAAMYGSAANNGVIIITTKSGKSGKIKIEASSNLTLETPLVSPDFQTEYGGRITNSHAVVYDGWGGKISELSEDDISKAPYITNSPRDKVKDFFQLGVTNNNSISISGGSEKSQTYFSFARTSQQGLTPKNKFYRNNILIKQTYKLWENKVKVDVSLSYINQEVNNIPFVGKAGSALYSLYRTPANIDLRYYENNYQHLAGPDDSMVKGIAGAVNRKLQGHQVQTWDWYTQNVNNPYWVINKNQNESTKERILSSITVNSKIIQDFLKVQARLSSDQKNTGSKRHEYASTNGIQQSLSGEHRSSLNRRNDLFGDVLLTYDNKTKKSVSVNVTVGGSAKRVNTNSMYYINRIDTSGVPNAFHSGNSLRNKNQSSISFSEKWGNNWSAATFATGQIGYKNKFFIEGSYRSDWDRSFQQFAFDRKFIKFGYSSFGANALLHEIYPSLKNIFGNLKIRGSYSLVGNAVPNRNFSNQDKNETGGVTVKGHQFLDPRPETTEAIEFGIEASTFENRLSFDITAYQNTLDNQLMYNREAGKSTPYNSGAVRNRGIEVSLKGKIIKNQNWGFSTGLNFAYNGNKILSTYTPATGIAKIVSKGDGNFRIKFVAGQKYGDIYVNSFSRDENGHIILDSENTPIMTAGSFKTCVGNSAAHINLGWNNSINYKKINFYCLINGKIGGKVMSLTQADMDRYGLSKRTAEARNNGGLIELPDGSGRKVDAQRYYMRIGENPMEDYVYDATNFRLREMSLGYSFQNMFNVIESLSVNIIARNVGFIYKNAPVDPDISISTSNGFGGIDVYALPTTRTVGLNLKVSF